MMEAQEDLAQLLTAEQGKPLLKQERLHMEQILSSGLQRKVSVCMEILYRHHLMTRE